MSVSLTDDVTHYVDAVREALSDLPPAQRDELLEDLSQHLDEVAAETDGPLSIRLGAPTAYAEELRASIGLAAEPRPEGRRMHDLAARLTGIRETAAAHPTSRAVLDFLPELRPGWWVLRGYLFVAVPSVLFDYAGPGSFPWPTFSGSRTLGVLATGAAIVASVALGRRTVRGPRWRRLVVVGNSLLALVALVALGSGRAVPEPSSSSGVPNWPGYLTGQDGSPITSIFAYGADGRPLTGVRLYDQNGRPIETLADPVYGGTMPSAPPLPPAGPSVAASLSPSPSAPPSPSASPAPSPDPAPSAPPSTP